MPDDNDTPSIQWHDLAELGIEGKGWADTATPYERLPARAKDLVPEKIWLQSLCAAGLCVHFETDAPAIHVKWTVTEDLALRPHQASTGKSGFDLYAVDPDGQWRWVTCFAPSGLESEGSTPQLAAGRRRYRLYLPLRNPLKEAFLGIPEGAAFEPIPPRTGKPIVYYGTSIVHGTAASRPGMCHAAILERRLGKPLINLGFGGAGRMESVVADLLAELDPCLYIVDCLPNMTADQVHERAFPLVKRLRGAHPEVPIVLVEDRTYTNAWIRPEARKRNDTSRAALREAFDRLQQDGVEGLTYVEGEHLLGDDGEGAVDSSHPTDLGFWRMADALEPVLCAVL